MRQFFRHVAAWVLFAATSAALGQPSAIVLVAKPGLLDPNFRESVVLVTRTADAQAVGVILNRPAGMSLAELWGDSPLTANYKDAVFFGGPVMRRSVIALFRSASPPPAPAFAITRHVYLSMHPDNIEPLLSGRRRTYRLFAGFSGWAAGQLENEIALDGWYVLPAREEWLFRSDTSSLWRELIDRATNERAALGTAMELAILLP